MSPEAPRRPRWQRIAGALGTVLILGVIAGALLSGRQGDLSRPGVEFTSTSSSVQTAPTPAGARHDPKFEWPVFGYTKDRAKTFALRDPSVLHPPYDERWARRGSVLLEFPPVLGNRSLFLLKNNGALYAMSRRTGHVSWKTKIGSLAAASPAFAHNTVFAVVLERFKGAKGGRVVALDARSGRTRWSRKLPARAESSPLVDRGRVFFGSEDGTVYSLDASDGSVRWRYKAAGAVKGAVAMDAQRNLYFGDYGGKVQSIRARDGSRRWQTGTTGGAFGLKAGQFYSTAAVAFGRVFIGNTDGNVYSFGTRTGKLAWRKATGDYVYSSPAVARLAPAPPTVYIGSYDRKLYAIDARSGRTRWTRPAGGKVSGGITVIGDLVFFSTLSKTTAAVGARTGRPIWRTRRGAFNPGVTDGRRIYLVGYSSVFALTPKRLLGQGARGSRARRAHASRRARRSGRSERSKRRARRRRHR